MAQEWCVLYGVMEEDDAAKAYKRMLKRKGAAPPPPLPTAPSFLRIKKCLKLSIILRTNNDSASDHL